MNSPSGANVTHNAADPGFTYYGRWHAGTTAISINSGSTVEFAYVGRECTLVFDVSGFTQFPAVFVQVDGGNISKTTLSRDVGTVPVMPAYRAMPTRQPPFPVVSSRYHVVRFWIATHSLYLMPETGKQWTTLVGGCKFRGAALGDGKLIPLPRSPNQIEFLGDSITQGLRLLYTGTDNDIGQQMPYANWPQLVADMLGMKPVVTGFGGHGLTSRGTCGVPPTNESFPYVYDNVRWKPAVEPLVVVIYHGTNDGVPATEFEDHYRTYLATIRKAYPKAVIFAACPHNRTDYAPAIRNAVGKMRDQRILFLDYSSGVISADETCDGCHLNPGGAVALAIKLAGDIRSHLGPDAAVV